MLTFGEYAAMYLMVWGWPGLGLQKWEDIQDLLPESGDENRAKLKETHEQQLAHLEKFAETLPKVRRLLANIPVYMIFDDHEVTDDWNLNRR